MREYALELVRQSYRDFGPTLATEALLERHGIRVGRETVRKWMVADGLWLSRKQRRTFHQPRLRRECVGELVQIDGSEHRWFERRGEPCTLLVFIDDATSRLMQLRFVPSESTNSYFKALEGYLDAYDSPVAFYSDKHSVFRGYGITSHSAQGLTADRVIVNIDTDGPRALVNSHLAYDAISRASGHAHVYTNDTASLGAKLATEHNKTAAVEFRQPAQPKGNELSQTPAAPAQQQCQGYSLGLSL